MWRAPRRVTWERRWPWRGRATHRPGRPRRTWGRPARARASAEAGLDRSRRESLRPVGGDGIHIGHCCAALTRVLRVIGEPTHLFGERRTLQAFVARLQQRGAHGLGFIPA